jgi:hypothetical protein
MASLPYACNRPDREGTRNSNTYLFLDLPERLKRCWNGILRLR